jgi:hypothetical protein
MSKDIFSMKSSFLIAIIIAVLILVIGGARFLVSKTPLKLEGKTLEVWNSVSECAQNQKDLYLTLEAYIQEHGQLLDEVDTLVNILINERNVSTNFLRCPLAEEKSGDFSYQIFPENFGRPDKVLIKESKNKHANTFMLWFKGFTPRVETMGDGKVYMFKGGKGFYVQAKRP